jgi:hypothetical protein
MCNSESEITPEKVKTLSDTQLIMLALTVLLANIPDSLYNMQISTLMVELTTRGLKKEI